MKSPVSWEQSHAAVWKSSDAQKNKLLHFQSYKIKEETNMKQTEQTEETGSSETSDDSQETTQHSI
jgi:hypothetical protein